MFRRINLSSTTSTYQYRCLYAAADRPHARKHLRHIPSACTLKQNCMIEFYVDEHISQSPVNRRSFSSLAPDDSTADWSGFYAVAPSNPKFGSTSTKEPSFYRAASRSMQNSFVNAMSGAGEDNLDSKRRNRLLTLEDDDLEDDENDRKANEENLQSASHQRLTRIRYNHSREAKTMPMIPEFMAEISRYLTPSGIVLRIFKAEFARFQDDKARIGRAAAPIRYHLLPLNRDVIEFSRSGRIDEALQLIRSNPTSIFSFTLSNVLCGLFKVNRIDDIFILYNLFSESTELVARIYTTLIQCNDSRMNPLKAYKLMKSQYIFAPLFFWYACRDYFAKTSADSAELVELLLDDGMLNCDQMINLVTSYLVYAEYSVSAESPNLSTTNYENLLQRDFKLPRMDLFIRIFDLAMQRNLRLSQQVLTVAILCYSHVGDYKRLTRCTDYVMDVSHNCSIYVYNILLESLMRLNQFEQALTLIKMLHEKKIALDTYTFSIVLKFALEQGNDRFVMAVYNEMLNNIVPPNIVHFNLLLSSLIRSKQFKYILPYLDQSRPYLKLDRSLLIRLFHLLQQWHEEEQIKIYGSARKLIGKKNKYANSIFFAFSRRPDGNISAKLKKAQHNDLVALKKAADETNELQPLSVYLLPLAEIALAYDIQLSRGNFSNLFDELCRADEIENACRWLSILMRKYRFFPRIRTINYLFYKLAKQANNPIARAQMYSLYDDFMALARKPPPITMLISMLTCKTYSDDPTELLEFFSVVSSCEPELAVQVSKNIEQLYLSSVNDDFLRSKWFIEFWTLKVLRNLKFTSQEYEETLFAFAILGEVSKMVEVVKQMQQDSMEITLEMLQVLTDSRTHVTLPQELEDFILKHAVQINQSTRTTHATRIQNRLSTITETVASFDQRSDEEDEQGEDEEDEDILENDDSFRSLKTPSVGEAKHLTSSLVQFHPCSNLSGTPLHVPTVPTSIASRCVPSSFIPEELTMKQSFIEQSSNNPLNFSRLLVQNPSLMMENPVHSHTSLHNLLSNNGLLLSAYQLWMFASSVNKVFFHNREVRSMRL